MARVGIVPEPAFEEERLLRIYDVSPLTRVMQDFPGPALPDAQLQ
mgnify:CR=1 FL=1